MKVQKFKNPIGIYTEKFLKFREKLSDIFDEAKNTDHSQNMIRMKICELPVSQKFL